MSEKERLFEDLFALEDDENDAHIDEGRKASLKALKSARPTPTAISALSRKALPPSALPRSFSGQPSPRRIPPLIERSVSAPGPRVAQVKGPARDVSLIKETPSNVLSSAHPHLKPTMSSPSVPAKRRLDELATLPRAPGRKKREAKIKLVQQDRRIFNDLVFFFFPNNDIHTTRRMRITKALEFGATWVAEWCDAVTHVVIDKNIQFDEIKDYLKIDAFPGSAVVVNEKYPIDCIMYRCLVDSKQPHYQVQGYQTPNTGISTADAPSSSGQSSQSLQLKSAKDVNARAPKTPSRTDESCNDLIHGPIVPEGDSDEEFPLQIGEKSQDHDDRLDPEPSVENNDPLEQIILETKNSQYLPLDTEDEEISTRTSDKGDTDDDTEDEWPNKVQKNSWQGTGSSYEKFQCMDKHDGKTKDTNPNARTIGILSEMCNYYEQSKDEWRSRSYRRAIATLRKQDHKILTKEEAGQLPFIGQRIAAKIEEIVWTNRLRRLDNARLDPMDEALQTLLKIYGVGLSQATKWVMRGLKTLEDLEKHDVPLTPNQKIGISHYDDFNTRIPRAEVVQHAAVVRSALHRFDSSFSVTIGGSYRRGAETSGDIDLIISSPILSLARLQTVVFDELVPKLTRAGFLKAALASTSNRDVGGGTKWHGASALPTGSSVNSSAATSANPTSASIIPRREVWRRLDLLLVPADQLGAALLYFTGNDIFNRSMRLLASRKGMRLNQRGLYRDVMRGKGRVKITEGVLVESRSERRIFEVLGVPWRPPEHRIC